MLLPPPLDATNSFSWQIPWDRVAPNSAADMTRLNAGPMGRIVVKNGKFVNEATGKRVRFLATNVGTEAAFPTKREADLRAAQIARSGINLVRLHHLNNGWATEAGGSIWKKGRNWVEIDPAQVDKLDYFVAALIKRGVYVNMNLQVSREYVEEHGFPPSVRELKQFAKKIDKVNPRMIELQREFAKDLIGRKNPYLGRMYKDEPGLAIVEINNENSLVGWPGESPGAGLDGFPEPFRSEIQARWIDWLRKTYRDDAGLRAAWPRIEEFTGPSLTDGSSKWTHENQGNMDITYVQTPGEPGEPPSLRAEVKTTDGVGWHAQAHVSGLNLEPGKDYVVTFRAKADRDVTVGVDSRLDRPDWRFLGLGSSVRLGPEWREYSLGFRATDPEPGHGRIGFVLGEKPATVEIADFRVRPGKRSMGLPDGESLEKGNVSFPSSDGSVRSRDWTRFLTETETAYSEGMRQYLRDELGFRNPMIDSQIAWGGLTALARERDMEFADNHAYWNHPTFKGGDWNPNDYFVTRSALVNEWGGGYGTLGNLARDRVLGKPYAISEYDHPAPSDFVSEMMPLAYSFGAWQDWDAIYTFAWSNTREGTKDDGIAGYFDVDRNPAVAAFYPAAAVMFRQSAFPTSRGIRGISVDPVRPYEPDFTQGSAWQRNGEGADPGLFRLGIALGKAPSAPAAGTPYRTLAGDGGKIVVGSAPGSALIAGFVNGRKVDAGPLTISFGKFGGGFASAALVPVDGATIAKSGRMLLTLVGRVENPGWKWNADRTSVGNDWGRGPTICERIPGRVTLRSPAKLSVWALDGSGKRVRKLPVTVSKSALSFATADTLWYEVAAK